MSVSEETLVSWSNGPSQTEMDKCGNAERAIRKAIDANEELSKLDISIFATGSYAVRTNVRQDSDVDVCLRYNSAWFAVYPEGTSMATFGHSDATVTFPVFKNKVGNALRQYFLDDNVTHGGKAFTIHANTYRIDTDVLPTFERRRYFQNPDRSFSYIAGVHRELSPADLRQRRIQERCYKQVLQTHHPHSETNEEQNAGGQDCGR
jgi:hypothetical protein